MKNKIWYAVALLLVAAAIVAGSLGCFSPLTGGQIVLIAFMAVLVVFGFKDMLFSAIYFPLGVLYINFGKMIGIPEIGVWPTLGVCACLAIASNLIADSVGKRKPFEFSFNKKIDENGSNEEVTSSADHFFDMVRVGNKSRYVSSKNFTGGEIRCTAGNIEVYLDKAEVPSKNCTINISCRMGNVELYVPASWNIDNGIEKICSNIDFDGPEYEIQGDAVTLHLTGKVSYGNLEIHRI